MKFYLNQYYPLLIRRRRGEKKDTNTTKNKRCLQQMLLSQFRKVCCFITSSKMFITSSSTMIRHFGILIHLLQGLFQTFIGYDCRTQSSALSFEKNIFVMLEMVKNGIFLGGASKQNALFSEKMCPKNALIPSPSRIGPVLMPPTIIIFVHSLFYTRKANVVCGNFFFPNFFKVSLKEYEYIFIHFLIFLYSFILSFLCTLSMRTVIHLGLM